MNPPARKKTSAKPPEPAKPYHHGNLRRALLEQALVTLETEGVEALTLRELARRIGVSHAGPYRHFPDKAQLMCAVAAHGFELLVARLAAETDTRAAARDRVQAAMVGYLEFGRERPALVALMFGGAVRFDASADLKHAAMAAFQSLVDVIRPALPVQRQEDAPAITLGLWAQAHGMLMLLVAGLKLHELAPGADSWDLARQAIRQQTAAALDAARR